jgi:hypothetical protein
MMCMTLALGTLRRNPKKPLSPDTQVVDPMTALNLNDIKSRDRRSINLTFLEQAGDANFARRFTVMPCH